MPKYQKYLSASALYLYLVSVSVSVFVSCIFCLFDMLWLYLFLCTISGFPFTTCQLTFQATNTYTHSRTHTHIHRERLAQQKLLHFYFVIIKFVCCCWSTRVQVEFSSFLRQKSFSRFLLDFSAFLSLFGVVGTSSGNDNEQIDFNSISAVERLTPSCLPLPDWVTGNTPSRSTARTHTHTHTHAETEHEAPSFGSRRLLSENI